MRERWRIGRRSAMLWSGALWLLAGCGPGPTSPGDETFPDSLPRLEGSWTSGPPLPAGLHGAGIVSYDGYVYLVGGARGPLGSDELTITEVLRAPVDEPVAWTRLGEYPIDAMDVGLAVFEGTLFGLGGLAYPSNRWARAFSYEPGSDSWVRRPDPPERLGRVAAIAVGGAITLIEQGGSGGVWRYDPRAESWTAGARMLDERSDFWPALVDDTVYVVGGKDPVTVLPGNFPVQAYDPDADRWSTVTHAPQTREEAAAALVGRRIHVVGGRDHRSDASTDHLVYDVDEARWYRAPDLPGPLQAALAVAPGDGSLWIVGGWDQGRSPHVRHEVWIYWPSG